MKIKENWNMKKTLTLTTILLVMIFLGGCGSPTQVLAKQNAMNYIEEKYGFKPKVKGVETEYVDEFFSSQKSGAYVFKMEHDGDEFLVYATGLGSADACADTYQYDEILYDFETEIADAVGGRADIISLAHTNNYFNSDDNYRVFFVKYYDGTNLYEVLTEAKTTVTMIYLDGRPVHEFDESLMDIGRKYISYDKLMLEFDVYSYDGSDDYEADAQFFEGQDKCLSPYAFSQNVPHAVDGMYLLFTTSRTAYASPIGQYEIRGGEYVKDTR